MSDSMAEVELAAPTRLLAVEASTLKLENDGDEAPPPEIGLGVDEATAERAPSVRWVKNAADEGVCGVEKAIFGADSAEGSGRSGVRVSKSARSVERLDGTTSPFPIDTTPATPPPPPPICVI